MTYKGSYEDAEDDGHDKRPHGDRQVLLDDDGQAQHEAEHHDGHVPVPGSISVVLDHVGVVPVVVFALARGLVSGGDVLAPEEGSVGDESTDLSLRVSEVII